MYLHIGPWYRYHPSTRSLGTKPPAAPSPEQREIAALEAQYRLPAHKKARRWARFGRIIGWVLLGAFVFVGLSLEVLFFFYQLQ